MVCLTLLSSFPIMDFISGQLISLTKPIHMIWGHFVNKPQILFCDRAPLSIAALSNSCIVNIIHIYPKTTQGSL